MSALLTRPRFLLLLAIAAAFIIATSRGLPDVVASHFGTSGAADGFMPVRVYVGLMLVLLVGLPALLVFMTWGMLGREGARINLPHKDHWLAPERREETVAYLRQALLGFGAGLVVFLCYVHGLVVLANRQQPPRLDHTWFIGGLIVFLAGVALWLRSFHARFRRAG